MTFNILSPAQHDFLRALRWYLDDQLAPRAANRFADKVSRIYTEIRNDPERYPPKHRGLRAWPLMKFPFFVIYRLKADDITVASIKHKARDAGYLRQFE